jgi:Ca2+-binding RTX toxin-like protein
VRRILISLCAGLALLAAPSASAAISCTFDAAQARVTVTLSASLDTVYLSRAGNAIQWSIGGVPAQCGAATVKNTNRIDVTATGGGQQRLELDLGGGPFAPGKTKEAKGVSEIEIFVDLGASTDVVNVFGTPGPDVFRMGTGGMNLNADADLDIVAASVESWQARGVAGNDVISAAGGAGTGGELRSSVVVYGGSGSDVLTGGAAGDDLNGETGADRIVGRAGQDGLSGGPGPDVLVGGDGADYIYPEGGKDMILAGPGADYMYAEATADGSDVFSGGPGYDYATSYLRTGNQSFTLDGRANDGLAGEKDNILRDVEVVYSGAGNDKLTGDPGNNTFDGGAGADVLIGGGGNDDLYGGAGTGPDVLRGGAGDDSLLGSDGGDTLDGGPGDDYLSGGLGNDVVQGGAGEDNLSEGTAASGADVLRGGPGRDSLSYSRTLGVTVKLDATANDGEGAGAEGDNVASDIEAVYGGQGADTFVGDPGDNTFYGYSGADIASGGAGADFLHGGASADTLTGAEGRDTLVGDLDNDTLNAVDGDFDYVYGGAGTDVCNTDAMDYKQDCP